MIDVVDEFFEAIYWSFRRILDRDGISMTEWAFLQRGLDYRGGVRFAKIMEVTGESKDNVRRAAAKLKGFADIVVDPNDHRARKLVLNKWGRSHARTLMSRLEKEMFRLLGARDGRSDRVEEFKLLLWDASAYLQPSDLASKTTIARSKENRKEIRDNSLDYVEESPKESVWIEKEDSDVEIPW